MRGEAGVSSARLATGVRRVRRQSSYRLAAGLTPRLVVNSAHSVRRIDGGVFGREDGRHGVYFTPPLIAQE